MFKTEFELEVRYYETDQMGIVHHSNYVRYFECARNAMMKDLGLPIEYVEANNIMFPVVSVELKYKHVAKMGDRLRIVTTFLEWPRAKMKFKQEVYNQRGEMVCYGTVVVCFLRADTRLPVRAPQFFLDKIEPYFTPEERDK